MFAFEKFSHESNFQFFDLIISYFENYKLEQKNWNNLFITKTKTSEVFGYFTTEIEFVKKK